MSKTTKFLLVILCLVIVAAACITGYFYHQKKIAQTKEAQATRLGDRSQLIVGSSSDFISGNYPVKMNAANDEISFFSNIYQPLAARDKDRKITAGSGLASNWVNPDNNTWRFTINSKAKFSDGTSVTADDVKYTYDTVMQNNYQIASLLPPIKEVKAVDNHTVDFITSVPNPTLVNQLTYLLIFSKNDALKNGIDNPIGSGPYKLATADTAKGELRHLVVNSNYWGDAPKIKEVIIKDIKPADKEDQYQAWANALKAKQVDIAMIGDAQSLAVVNEDSDINIKQWQDSAVAFVTINSLTDSPLRNLNVRKAIAMTINPSEVASEGKNAIHSQAVDEIVTSSIFGYNPDIKRPSYSLTEAKALLTEAGYPNGFTTKILTAEGDMIASDISKQLAKIGITVNVDYAGSDYINRLMSNDYTMAYASFSADSGDASEALNQLFHTKGDVLGTSNLGYSNKDVDSLIEKANSIMDMKQRQTYLQQAIKLITDDVAYIPLFSATTMFGIDKDIYWQPRADGFLEFSEMAALQQ